MDVDTILDKINHDCGLIRQDIRLALAYKATGGPMERAERIRDLMLTHRSHRASLLLDVAALVEQATIEISGGSLV